MSSFLKLGIIGYPLEHSLSPRIHAALLRLMTLQGEYSAYPLPPDDLPSGLARLEAEGVRGLNVTIPHKVSVMPLLDWIHPEAQELGAVNTIAFGPGGRKEGYNTDLTGFIRSLPNAMTATVPGSHMLILGAGGAARAVVRALFQLGATDITLAVRNPERARPLVRLATTMSSLHSRKTHIHLVTFPELSSLSSFQGVVNTTPVGMWPHPEASPLSAGQLETLPVGAFVCDLIYRPLETQLLREARGMGHVVLNGLDMLIYQGIAAFELWIGRSVPETALPRLRQLIARC